MPTFIYNHLVPLNQMNRGGVIVDAALGDKNTYYLKKDARLYIPER